MGYGDTSSRIIFYGLRLYNSKIVLHRHTNPIQQSVSTRTFSLGQATILHNGLKNKQLKSPFVHGAKQFYNAGSNIQVQELKASRGWRRWIWNLETAVALAFFSGVVALDIFNGRWETVPYTKRSQFVLLPASIDKKLGERRYEVVKEIFKGKVVPPLHPQSVRVRTIAQNIIEAFRQKEDGDRSKNDWDVLLVDIPIHRTLSFPCGKIVIFTGTLDSCGEDAEIAAFIAPEVGHAVARHTMEKFSMLKMLPCLFLLILHVFLSSMPSLLKYLRFPLARSVVYFITSMAVTRLLHKFYSLKMDVEADYIGLLLVASAGYDPRVALRAREKMGSNYGGSSWEKMRARLLVLKMEEALSIYREVMEGRDV